MRFQSQCMTIGFKLHACDKITVPLDESVLSAKSKFCCSHEHVLSGALFSVHKCFLSLNFP